MNFYTTSVLVLISFYILLLIVVFFFQRNLLYHPSVNNYLNNQVKNEPTEIEKINIRTSDNIDLAGWFYEKDLNKFKTILFFHGNAGSLEKHEATMTLEIDGTKQNIISYGNGPVDATFNAIKEITNYNFRLKLYQVHAITAGTDAQGEVTVRLEDENLTSQAKGSNPDIIVASAKAYINALNKLIFKKSKSISEKTSEIKVKGV